MKLEIFGCNWWVKNEWIASEDGTEGYNLFEVETPAFLRKAWRAAQ